jgi:hypothetical protein
VLTVSFGTLAVYQGEVDEVRLAAVKRSDGWIAAQHRSMTDVFVTYGKAEATCP